MRVSQMAKLGDFDINKLLGSKNKTVAKNMPTNSAAVSFAQPNWNMIPTKGGTGRSAEELEKAIIALAEKEASAGILAGTKERAALEREFMSLVSPDRRAAFAGYNGVSGSVFGNVTNAFGGRELMIYSSVERSWSTMPTQNELDMLSRFHEIYRNAFTAYEAEHGKVVGTPTVSPARFNIKI